MISDAFKSAYVNETGQQMQGIGTLTTSAKNIGTAVLGALGFSGALGEGLMAKGAQHALAGKIGGVGGSIMLATMEQKAATAKAAQQVSQAVELDQSQQVEASKTVFETLMNKKGMVETSFGEIDPNSPLGQKINEAVEAEEKIDTGFFKEKDSTIEDRVKKRMGETFDWRETGYLLQDGTRIDLSGRNQGNTNPGRRTVDHREIFDEEDYNTEETGGSASLIEFMKRGNIRVTPEYPGINITKEPTERQYIQIKNMAERLGWKEGSFSVDFDDENGDTVESLSYDGKIIPERIISDIKTYYKTGKIPKQEEEE